MVLEIKEKHNYLPGSSKKQAKNPNVSISTVFMTTIYDKKR